MIAWTVQTLAAAAGLMALVILLRRPFARAFGPRAAYALWLLPALRMVLPPLPGWHTLFVPVVSFAPGHATVGLVDVASVARMAPPPDPLALPEPLLQPAPPPAIAAHLTGALVLLWLGVAALWFGWSMWRYRRFMVRALADAVPLGRECGIEVLVSPAVPGPLATGIRRRRILLPADFLRCYTPEERHLALLHEGAHHDRRDIVANLAALAIRALHWWNPLAGAAYRAFRADQELACDATVLAGAGADRRRAYGKALLKSAVARQPAMACALNPKSQLTQRIRSMTRRPAGRIRLLAGAMIAAATIGLGAVATASGLAAAPVPPALPALPEPAVAPVAPMAPPPVAALPPLAAVPPVAPAPRPPRARSEAARGGGLSPADQRRIRRDLERAQAEADIAAARASQQAQLAWREAARAEAQAEIARRDIPGLVRASLASARSGLAAHCAALGAPLAADAGFDRLATCDGRQDGLIRASLIRARAAIMATRGLGDADRASALAGIDAEIARLRP